MILFYCVGGEKGKGIQNNTPDWRNCNRKWIQGNTHTQTRWQNKRGYFSLKWKTGPIVDSRLGFTNRQALHSMFSSKEEDSGRGGKNERRKYSKQSPETLTSELRLRERERERERETETERKSEKNRNNGT